MRAPKTSSFRRISLGALALLGALLLAPSAASAAAKVGAVYTQSNDPTDNHLIAFDRFVNGTLAFSQSVSTGGVGEGSLAPGCAGPMGMGGPPACPITDSQGSVGTTPAGNLVFVTNAGSDTISSFRVSPTRGLTLVDQIHSGGDFPQSLTIHGNLLYVLNEHSGNIDGFKFTTRGVLSEIPGSNRSLITPGAAGVAAQVGFDFTGSTLTVTERATNIIDTFVVRHGVAGPAIFNPSAGLTPFGFAYTVRNQAVVTNAGAPPAPGSTSVYRNNFGVLSTLEAGVTTGGVAPCWVVITPDQRFAYVTNTVTKTIAQYRISPFGRLTFLGTVPIQDTEAGMAQFPTDVGISRDGRFVYTIVPSVFDTNNSFIEGFRVNPLTGRLTLLTETEQNLPIGLSGIAVR